MVLVAFAQIPEPSRSQKRHCGKLAKWYQEHWAQIQAWLPLIELRDDNDRLIDGYRELSDKNLL
jgi:hypothetical protein